MKYFRICPVCAKKMIVGKVEHSGKEKIVAMCKNKKCESIIVFGEPLQKAFSK